MKFFLFILSIVFQFSFGGILMMLVIFSASGIANGNELSKAQNLIFSISMVVLPLSSLATAGTLIYLYVTNSTHFSYWWHVLPFVLLIVYIVYASRFN